jgi:hypothetical protein
MSFKQTSQPENGPEQPYELETLIERVVERTVARLEGALESPFISSRQCAGLLGVTPEHLCAMRARGEGPRWSGDGRWTRYERVAVLKWLGKLPRRMLEEQTDSASAAQKEARQPGPPAAGQEK